MADTVLLVSPKTQREKTQNPMETRLAHGSACRAAFPPVPHGSTGSPSCPAGPTFPFHGSRENTSALADVVRLAGELQGGLVLRVRDGDCGAGDIPQQGVGRCAELHSEALGALEHGVIVDGDGAGLGVLPLLELHLGAVKGLLTLEQALRPSVPPA